MRIGVTATDSKNVPLQDASATRAQENSVRNLQELYTIAVGVALAFGIERLVNIDKPGFPVRMVALPGFLSLLVILIPFYHGAVRHLEDVYLEKQGRTVRRGALLADFVLLFVEGILLVTTAVLLRRPWASGWALTVLLAFDAAWGSFVYLVFSRERRPGAELKWVLINLVAVPLLVVFLVLVRWTIASLGIANTVPAEINRGLLVVLGFLFSETSGSVGEPGRVGDSDPPARAVPRAAAAPSAFPGGAGLQGLPSPGV